MKKIMVIGNCGSGKSTFSKKLHELTKLPLIHLDQEFWKPNWVEPSKEEWRKIVKKLVKRGEWIMDGNYSGTFDLRIPEADTIIYMDRSTGLTLYRVCKRIFQNYGKIRSDMPEGCRERWDWTFIHYVLTYNITRRRKRLELLDQLKNEKQVFIFKKDRELNNFLKNLATMNAF